MVTLSTQLKSSHGSIQSSKSNSRPEYIRHIGLAASALKRLDCLWSQSKLNITTKLRIYYTCVLPILLYASETWTLIQAEWNKLDSFHVRCRQRRILHIARLRIQRRSSASYRPVRRLVHHSQAKTGPWSRRQTSTRCTSKPDPTNLHQDVGW